MTPLASLALLGLLIIAAYAAAILIKELSD